MANCEYTATKETLGHPYLINTIGNCDQKDYEKLVEYRNLVTLSAKHEIRCNCDTCTKIMAFNPKIITYYPDNRINDELNSYRVLITNV